MLILLDLLGTSAPTFYSMYPATHRWHKLLVSTEKRLRTKNLLEADTRSRSTYFLDRTLYDSTIEDDHIPFVEKGQRKFVVIHFFLAYIFFLLRLDLISHENKIFLLCTIRPSNIYDFCLQFT